MARSLRSLAAAAICAVALLGARGDAQTAQNPQDQPPPKAGQQPPAPNQPATPLFKTGINFVRVDVIVSDKQGNVVSDLKPGDFEVTEEGKPQTIETFKLIKLDGGSIPTPEGPPKAIHTDADEEAEAARDDVRLFAIFLDDYHVDRGASMAVREPLIRFLQTLGPSDMVTVMYPLEPLSELRFTRNHEAVERAVEKFLGRKYDYTPMNDFEQQYANYPAETVEQIRNQVSLSALKGLTIHMGSLKEGRKSLILVSEGYSNTLPPQMRDPNAGMPGLGNPNALNPLAGANDPNEDRYQFFNDLDLQTDLRSVFDAANKNNTAIYPVDPRGLAGQAFDISHNVGLQVDSKYLAASQDVLREIASNTDGRAIVNRNDIAVGMKQIARDSSAYYLIGYNSTQAPSDGKFHEIRVRVKRPGAQVRARKGYWALTAEETAKATAPAKPGPPPAVSKALSVVEQPKQARVIRTWIGTSRGENGKTRVTFVWEPIGGTPGDRARGDEAPARVALLAAGNDGAPVFRGRVPDAALASNAPAATGLPAGSPVRAPQRVTFDAPPGTLQLRVSVEGSGSQVIDSEIREVSVPDLTAPKTVLGTPEVLRARTIPELRQFKADPDAVPTALREFVRTDRLLVRVPAYAPGGTVPTVTARLLNRDGKAMADVPVGAPSGSAPATIEMPLANLAPGEYILEVTAKGSDGDAQQLVGFRVAS